jgi:hypothetical protein
MVVDNHHVTERGWTLAPTGPCSQTGGAPIHISGCLGLLFMMMLIIGCWWV